MKSYLSQQRKTDSTKHYHIFQKPVLDLLCKPVVLYPLPKEYKYKEE